MSQVRGEEFIADRDTVASRKSDAAFSQCQAHRSRTALHESIFTNAKNELSSEVTRTTRPVLGTLEAAPSWLAARLRLLALGLALLRPIGLHRACM